MTYKVFTLLSVFLISFVGNAKITEWHNPGAKKTITTIQWEVNDIVYKVREKIEKPFFAEATATVSDKNGSQEIPLFFNGDGQWVFRYSASQPGEKTFLISSEIKSLNGKKGRIIVSPNTKKNRHGGIVRNPENPRHFYYEDGTPYFNLAFECDWLFALDYGNAELPKTKQLLGHIAENGFNQIVMNVFAYDVDTNWVADALLKENPQHNYGAPKHIFPFLGNNDQPDHSALNLEFFKHFDRVIAELHDHEIVSHLMVYVWNKLVSWPEPGSEADNRYYEHVIKRYQAFPNIIWDVSKEATSKIALSKFKNIGEHIRQRCILTRQLDAYNRLVSVHAYGFCKNNKDVVDFISIQDWKLSIYDQMLNAWNQFPDMPVFNIEHGGYEESPYNVFPGGYDNAEVCLRRNYLCLFAGTYTTYYWQGTSWSAIIHNPFHQPEGFYQPKFEYFKHLKGLFDRVSFENFEPVTKYNSRSFNLTNYKEGEILLYVPKEVYNDGVRTQLEKEFNFENATQQWFNTLTGEYTPEEKVEFKNYYTIWDERPYRDEADAILIVRNLKQKK